MAGEYFDGGSLIQRLFKANELSQYAIGAREGPSLSPCNIRDVLKSIDWREHRQKHFHSRGENVNNIGNVVEVHSGGPCQRKWSESKI